MMRKLAWRIALVVCHFRMMETAFSESEAFKRVIRWSLAKAVRLLE